MTLAKLPVLCLLALLIIPGTLLAEEPQIGPDLTEIKLTAGLQHYMDESGALDFDGARARSPEEWRPVTTNGYGYTEANVWLRFTVANKGLVPQPVVLFINYEYLDEVEIFGLVEGAVQTRIKTGRALPFSQREYPDIKFASDLLLPPGASMEVYLRVRTHSSMVVPIHLLTPYSLADRRSLDFLPYAILGAFLVLFILNAFFFIFLRDRNILYYLLYLTASSFYYIHLPGFTFKFLWPESPHLNSLVNHGGFGPIMFAALLFTQKFLRTGLYFPRLNRLYHAVYVLIIISIVMLPFTPLQFSEILVTALLLPMVMGLILWAVFMLLLRGQKFARFYLFAWILYIGFGSVYTLQIFAILPPDLFGLIPTELPVVGYFIEMVFFPVAIGDRFFQLMKESGRGPADMKNLFESDVNTIKNRIEELMDANPGIAPSNADLAKATGLHLKAIEEFRNRDGISAIQDGKNVLLPYHTILAFSGRGVARSRSTAIITESKPANTTDPLDLLEQILPSHFCRSHRSWILNLQHVASLRSIGSGMYDALMDDGKTRVPVSRRYAKIIRQKFDNRDAAAKAGEGTSIPQS